MKRILAAFGLFSICLLCQCSKPSAANDAGPGPHRSPIDLVLVDGGRRAITANHTADSLSLVDLDRGTVLAEVPCGKRPFALALSPDGKMLAVSHLHDHDVGLFAITGGTLRPLRRIPVGPLPRGVVFSRDGKLLAVAVSRADEVALVDLGKGQVVERLSAPREPRQLAVSPDGKWLAAASSRSGQVRVWNLPDRKLHWTRTIPSAFNLRGLSFTPDGKDIVVAHSINRNLAVSLAFIEQGWVIDSRLSRLPLQPDASPAVLQIALDPRSEAVGDPCGLAYSPDGKHVAVSGSGTHEVVLLQTQPLPWSTDAGDVIDGNLLDGSKFRRVPLGGRPMTIAFAAKGDRLAAANYLLDAVQVVDTDSARLARTISLGGPKEPGLARKGEALFQDATRSHNQWFSCQTCHTEGHTCCMNFDTLNDDSFNSPKMTPSLRNVTRTGPWTWHGRQKDLEAAVARSFVDTLHGKEITRDEARAVVAYLATLTPPPLPRKDSPAVARGQKIFTEKAGCARCHKAPLYTSAGIHDVLADAQEPIHKGYNPPSLLGLSDRGPYLHDGRAETLEEVLRRWHQPENLGGQRLTETELADLIEFLKAL